MANVPKGKGNLGPRAWVVGTELPATKPKKIKKKKKLISKPKKIKTKNNQHDPRKRSNSYPSEKEDETPRKPRREQRRQIALENLSNIENAWEDLSYEIEYL
jgi:hypothetical protein